MSIHVTDMLLRDLKQKGLEMSPGNSVTIPQPSPQKPGIVKKLSSIIARSQKQQSGLSFKIMQIMYSTFILIRNNTVFIYRYSLNQTTKQFDISLESTLVLHYNIKNIYTCDTKQVQDRDVPLLIWSQEGLGYFTLDIKNNEIAQRNFIKVNGTVLGVGWISDRECIIICKVKSTKKNKQATDNKEDIVIKYFGNVQGVLIEKSSVFANFVLQSNEILKRIWVMGSVDQNQDSLISIFYATVPKSSSETSQPQSTSQSTHQSFSMKLKIKQFIRTPDSVLIQSPKADYLLQTQSLEYSQNFIIIPVHQYFCLQLKQEILIVKKKYDKYMIMDNLKQVMLQHRIKLCKKGLVVSIGEKLMEINFVQFADPKCVKKILDVVEFPTEKNIQGGYSYSKNFREIWPILINKQYTLVFIFIDEENNEIRLSTLIKLQPMQKMLALAKKVQHNELQIIQDMALNLGIQKKDFYLKLWSTSKKQNSHIYQYLLPCKDVKSIKKQLKNVLRTRTIQVSEILKILEKISEINEQNLKLAINEKNYMEYVKNQFLRKKISLSQRDKMLDHRSFDKIYSSSLLTIFEDIVKQQLDPEQPKFDPLHSNLNYQPIKQLKSLQSVLQQFKVVLLQQYKTFLIKFLQKFPTKILQVLQTFPFLLPNHPFQIQVQKPSKTNQPILVDPKKNNTPQQLWFQTVTVNQWQAEVTKQKIQKRLLHYFPTSKVTQTVDQFYNSQYGKQYKLWKHGLITANIDQYTKKLKMLSGVQLYLDICQFANEDSVKKNGDPQISDKILDILKKKNGLTEPDLHYCKLYANMHYFMLKNKIMPKIKLQISYLTNLKPQNLIAMFFLQNKQRKQHIFDDFMALYKKKQQFNKILQKFVQSQNCSGIQLSILMKQLITKGHKFQQQNQDIIQILIAGVCQKVQIREDLLIIQMDQQQQCLIDHIQLNKQLALKINRIKRLRHCQEIFKCFGLEKMTYKELLDLEKDNQIFKLILNKYFQLREKQQRQNQLVVTIQGQQNINLENPRKLLTILIYLQQNVYYSSHAMQILIIFCLQLISWKQFQIVRSIINDTTALQTLQIQRQQLVEQLTLRALQSIYLDQQIIYQTQTREQIINILNIDDETTPLKIRQIAKLDLVVIFTQWGLVVHPSDIHAICTIWKEEFRNQFMEDLINKYIDMLNFGVFQEVYRLLEVTDKENIEVNVLNSQYVGFCDYYAYKLLEKRRYKQAAQVVSFLMDIQDVKVQYVMLAQTYLQNISQIFQQDQEKARKLIQLFIQKYDTPEQQIIKLLLKQNFEITDTVLRTWQGDRSLAILIDYHYCYEQSVKYDCKVKYDDLWEMAKKTSASPNELYFNFFFLGMGLACPKKGFSETVGISYNLDKLASLLTEDLDQLFDKDESLWFVNYTLLQIKFLSQGMLGQAADSLNIKIDKDKDKKQKLQLIIKQLRVHRAQNQRNDKILNILNKLRVEILNKNKMSSRKQRYRKKLKQIQQKQVERHRSQILIQKQTQPVVEDRPQVFLNWKKVQQQKRHLSSVSQYIMSQKQLIDKVFDCELQTSRIKSPKKPQPIVLRKNFLQGLFLPKASTNDLAQLIKSGEYEQVGKYPLGQVYQSIQKIFQDDPERDYRQVIEIFDGLNLGDPQKRNIFRIAKLYLDFLPNQIRRTLFPISFFTTPFPPSLPQQQKPPYIYSQLKPQLLSLAPSLPIPQLRELGTLLTSILTTSQFEAQFYFQVMVATAQQNGKVFDSRAALIAQQCVNGMVNSCPQFVNQYYKQILFGISKGDNEYRRFVKQILWRSMSQKMGYSDVAELIRNYRYDNQNQTEQAGNNYNFNFNSNSQDHGHQSEKENAV